MTRENVETKAARLLTSGRVVIQQAADGLVIALVRGDTDWYRVAYQPGRWSCDCVMRGRCSHLTAVQLVTSPSRALRLVEARAAGRGETS